LQLNFRRWSAWPVPIERDYPGIRQFLGPTHRAEHAAYLRRASRQTARTGRAVAAGRSEYAAFDPNIDLCAARYGNAYLLSCPVDE
jgi:hypothetical protein